MDTLAVIGARASDTARFLRPDRIGGVEALHATFVEHRYPPHLHEALTIAHVLDGAAGFELEGRWHLAPAGSVFVIPPNTVHTGQSASPGGYTYRVLYLEPHLLDERDGSESVSRWGRSPVVIRHPALAGALVHIHGALEARGAALEQGEALAILYRHLGELVRSAPGATGAPRAAHPAVRRAQSYIRDHWVQDFTLEELAAVAGLSPFHLTRCFRSHTGAPPSAYRRALRVQAAQRLLRCGVPPARTAIECGFYDQAHLTRHFKRVTGVTPARYVTANH